MPLYEYECDSCSSILAEFRSVERRDAAGECDTCGGAIVRIRAIARVWAPTRNGQ
jgi:putative FmdB family regulatory protein